MQHKDVAIITLSDEVPEMDNVRAVCLPSAGSRSVGRSATALNQNTRIPLIKLFIFIFMIIIVDHITNILILP